MIIADLPRIDGPKGRRVPVQRIYEMLEKLFPDRDALDTHILLCAFEHSGWDIAFAGPELNAESE